jgi:hypothetical protein
MAVRSKHKAELFGIGADGGIVFEKRDVHVQQHHRQRGRSRSVGCHLLSAVQDIVYLPGGSAAAEGDFPVDAAPAVACVTRKKAPCLFAGMELLAVYEDLLSSIRMMEESDRQALIK